MGMRPDSPFEQVWWRRHHRGSAWGWVVDAGAAGATGVSRAAEAVGAVRAVGAVGAVGLIGVTEEAEVGSSLGAVDRQRGQEQLNAYCDSSSCWRVSHGDETSMYEVRIWRVSRRGVGVRLQQRFLLNPSRRGRSGIHAYRGSGR